MAEPARRAYTVRLDIPVLVSREEEPVTPAVLSVCIRDVIEGFWGSALSRFVTDWQRTPAGDEYDEDEADATADTDAEGRDDPDA
jgi:hypothetical protein